MPPLQSRGGKNATSDFNNVLKKFTGKGRAYLMAAAQRPGSDRGSGP